MASLPVLYSFRRCPYAIRARMALSYAGVQVELREVVLRDKPAAMLEASPKGTVPILVLPDGNMLEESVDIMRWALAQADPESWGCDELAEAANTLVYENDFSFKTELDHYKYADRYPEYSMTEYRHRCEQFLQQLEGLLTVNQYFLRDTRSFADVAIFPFIRQFAFVDKDWFDSAPYPKLQQWLQSFLSGELFARAMEKHPPWQVGDTATVFPKVENKSD